MKYYIFLATLAIGLLVSCHSTKEVSKQSTEVVPPPQPVPPVLDKNSDPNNPVSKVSDDLSIECFDKTTAQPDMVCDEDNRPVCGCNLVNYKNACEATKAGVRYYSWGKCTKTKKTASK